MYKSSDPSNPDCYGRRVFYRSVAYSRQRTIHDTIATNPTTNNVRCNILSSQELTLPYTIALPNGMMGEGGKRMATKGAIVSLGVFTILSICGWQSRLLYLGWVNDTLRGDLLGAFVAIAFYGAVGGIVSMFYLAFPALVVGALIGFLKSRW
jgi:hypothetical protein